MDIEERKEEEKIVPNVTVMDDFRVYFQEIKENQRMNVSDTDVGQQQTDKILAI